MTFGDHATLTLLARAGQATRAATGVASDAHPEALHDARVALRRLRAALTAFAPAFAKERLEPVRAVARASFAPTSAARTHEVVRGLLEKLAPPGSVAATPLRAALDATGEELADGAAVALAGVPAVVSALEDLLAGPRLPAAWDAPGPVAAAAVTRAWRRAGRARAAIGGAADVDGLHQWRIALKKVRYTVEAFAPLVAAPPEDVLGHLRALQDALGELHDLDDLHARVLAAVPHADDALTDALLELDLAVARARVAAYDAAWEGRRARRDLAARIDAFAAALRDVDPADAAKPGADGAPRVPEPRATMEQAPDRDARDRRFVEGGADGPTSS